MAVKNVEFYINKAIEFYNEGKYDDAIVNYSTAIELNPNCPVAYLGRGVVYAKKGEYDKAISDFNKTIQLEPYNAKAYYNRGVVHYFKGKYDEAIDDCIKATIAEPDYIKAFLFIWKIYQKQGNLERAEYWYNKILERKKNLKNLQMDETSAFELEETIKIGRRPIISFFINIFENIQRMLIKIINKKGGKKCY